MNHSHRFYFKKLCKDRDLKMASLVAVLIGSKRR